MESLQIKPLAYGKKQAVKANIHGSLKYDHINGNLFVDVAVFTAEDELCEVFSVKLDKQFTDTWVEDSTILTKAIELLQL